MGVGFVDETATKVIEKKGTGTFTCWLFSGRMQISLSVRMWIRQFCKVFLHMIEDAEE